MHKPEILAPAGSLDRLKTAVLYGADAVYLGGDRFSLRARADNFSMGEIAKGTDFAHQRNAKVYVALNAFFHNQDFKGFSQHCRDLEAIGVDAVIASDLGVVRKIQSSSSLPIHLSTQASCLNSQAARLWKSLGIKRVVLGRELSLEESAAIAGKVEIEVEVFVHGAMCMAYSGNCTISNFTAGRDSNRGGCIQSCRFSYCQEIVDAPTKAETGSENSCGGDVFSRGTFMSSKDLSAVRLIPDLCASGIASLKIEGRMKSLFYVAATTKCYREAIDAFVAGNWTEAVSSRLEQELETFPHRDYCSGSLAGPAAEDSVYQGEEDKPTRGNRRFLGQILAVSDKQVVLRLYSELSPDTELELLPFNGPAQKFVAKRLLSVVGEEITSAKQESVVCLPREDCPRELEKLMIIRARVENDY